MQNNYSQKISRKEMLDVLISLGKYAPEAYLKMNQQQIEREYNRLLNAETK